MSENTLRMSKAIKKEGASIDLKKIILALQHLIAMFGATVLVPMLTGLDPSVALVAAGCGTLIFHLTTKGKVPVFLGSSFAFISGIITVREMFNGDLAYAQGGIIVAGFLYVAMSFLVRKIGVEKIKYFLPPVVVGPMIMVIGLNLVPVAFGMAKSNLIIAATTLAISLIIRFKGKGMVKQCSILIAVLSGYGISLAMGIVDTSLILDSKFVMIPNFTLPKFHMGAISVIAPIVIAVFMEHVGDITTNGQVVGKNFIQDPGLNRTLLGDGLATLFAGFIGGPANTTYGENTGVLALTKNYDPSILRLAAVLAVALGFISKVGGFLRSIPVPVMGGISLILFSMIALVGVKTIKNEEVKLNTKNLIIMGTIIIMGLGGAYIEKQFGVSLAITLTDTVKIQGLSLAAITGIVLNLVLNRK
ncbi:MAG: uracil-xanthine permease family protein [Anaeromicrobium sp.]|jgi:uracil permease|uniref:uracil-xanthine permease family protein n=1 Tax=Anaeromicrobium sp. TaxID=1929132 RepID=UPI0025FB5A02|nr:uracil-xanthine permease family protein [Anaeromicrobium sp.]MCT4593307.1 uracil-xanthine permease family protein [Anaeromicrobium sp.]